MPSSNPSDPTAPSLKPWSVIIPTVALAVRVAYGLWLDPKIYSPDGGAWMEAARSLLHQHAYGDFWKAPGYPFFLSAIFWVAGESVTAIRMVQSFLDAATCWLLIRLAEKTFQNRRSALLAGWMYAFYPYAIHHTSDVLAETLQTFTILLTFTACWQVKQQHSVSLRHFCWAGGLWGLSALVKPVLLPFGVLFALLFWWERGITRREGFWGVTMFALTAFLVISPWTWRNHRYYGQFILISTVGEELYLCNNPAIYGIVHLPAMDRLRLPDQHIHWSPQTREKIHSLGRMAADKAFRKEALKFITSNPVDYAQILFWRLKHFWRLTPKISLRAHKLAALATSGVYLPLGVLGLWLSRRRWRDLWPYYILFLSYTAVHLIVQPTIRYRIPIDLYMMIFASHAILWGYRKVRHG